MWETVDKSALSPRSARRGPGSRVRTSRRLGYNRRVGQQLPPTSPELLTPSSRPYFLWWTDATVEQFRGHLLDADPDRRAYWMAALLREANTRDVWLFVTPDQIRAEWPRLMRYLGRSREMWAYLLGMEKPVWPPALDPLVT